LLGIVYRIFQGLVGLLWANCDGPVVTGKLDTNADGLIEMTRPSGTRTEYHYFPGVESPAGCGSNSRYWARFLITQLGWAPVCGDGLCQLGESCVNCVQDCGECPLPCDPLCGVPPNCIDCMQTCFPLCGVPPNCTECPSSACDCGGTWPNC